MKFKMLLLDNIFQLKVIQSKLSAEIHMKISVN